MFVVQKLGMIEIGTFEMSGGTVGNSAYVGGERFGIALLDTQIPLSQSLCDYMGHRLAGGLSDGPSKPVGFRILDI